MTECQNDKMLECQNDRMPECVSAGHDHKNLVQLN